MSGTASKIAAIVRCVERARDEFSQAAGHFRVDFTHQDAAVLNILRGCEAAVDLANMLIRKRRIGVPGDMRDSFAILERAGLIPKESSHKMQDMIGFRNIAVHQYKDLDLAIVEDVIIARLDDLLKFAEIVRGQIEDDVPSGPAKP